MTNYSTTNQHHCIRTVLNYIGYDSDMHKVFSKNKQLDLLYAVNRLVIGKQ